MRKLLKATGISLILLVGGVAGAGGYHFATTPTFQMIAVYMDPDYGPSAFTWGAEKAFYIFHPEEADVEQLNREAGAQYVVDVFSAEEARPILEHLLEHGLDINSVETVTGKGLTALHAVALSNNRSGVELLLGYGADPQLTDNEGRTALELAKASDEARPEMDYGSVIELLEKATVANDKAQEPSQQARSG